MILSWWYGRNARERRALCVGAAVAASFIAYATLAPFAGERSRLIEELPQLREDLSVMRAQLAEIELLSSKVQAGPEIMDAASIRELLAAQSRDAGAPRLTEQTGGVLTFDYEVVDYGQLIDILTAIENRHRGAVVAARVTALDEGASRVSANVSVAVASRQ